MNQNQEIYTLHFLPSAGSSATMFHPWKSLAPDNFIIHPIDYPGHGTRIKEALIRNPFALINDIVNSIISAQDTKQNIVLFGHSLGAGLLPFVAQKIRKEFASKKIALIVLSGRSYRSKIHTTPLDLNDQSALLNFLQRYEGIPDALLENQTALDFFFPIIKNDILINNALLDIHSEIIQTSIPLLVFSGSEDKNVNSEALNEWQHITTQWRGVEFFKGGHFYLNNPKNIEAMIKSISSHLSIIKHIQQD